MKLAAIFCKWMPQELFEFLKARRWFLYIKWRVQRNLEGMMMRMMRTRRGNLQWKQNASRSWWKLEPEPKLKVEIPSQHCQMEQMLQIRREAQLLMDWTHPIRCIRLRAWVFVEALSRRPWQSSWFYEVQEAWKHPTSTIQVYIFWDKLLLPRWDFGFSCSCCKAIWDSTRWFMEVSSLELRAFDLSTNFGLFLFREAWAYQLKKFFARRTRVCGLIMPGQGEFYIMVFHWCHVKLTFHVSQRYRRADIRITFAVSASLPMVRPTVDILSRCLCLCRIQIVESISSTYLVCV